MLFLKGSESRPVRRSERGEGSHRLACSHRGLCSRSTYCDSHGSCCWRSSRKKRSDSFIGTREDRALQGRAVERARLGTKERAQRRPVESARLGPRNAGTWVAEAEPRTGAVFLSCSSSPTTLYAPPCPPRPSLGKEAAPLPLRRPFLLLLHRLRLRPLRPRPPPPHRPRLSLLVQLPSLPPLLPPFQQRPMLSTTPSLLHIPPTLRIDMEIRTARTRHMV